MGAISYFLDRAMRNVDRAAIERAERERVARANAERREFLYDQLFRNVSGGQDVASLRSDGEAMALFDRAIYVDNRQQVAILRVAFDNRWPSVISAFVKHWGADPAHPIADTVKELWKLT